MFPAYLPFVDTSWHVPRSDTRGTARLSALVRQQCAREQNGDTWLPISALTVIDILRVCDSGGGGDDDDGSGSDDGGGSGAATVFCASAEESVPRAYLT